jgi:hypothetical protein
MANSNDRGKSTGVAQILIEMTRSVGGLGERPMAFARSGDDFEFAGASCRACRHFRFDLSVAIWLCSGLARAWTEPAGLHGF